MSALGDHFQRWARKLPDGQTLKIEVLDVNLAGLALGVREIDAEFDIEDADATAAAIPQRYRITYRTLSCDLAQLG